MTGEPEDDAGEDDAEDDREGRADAEPNSFSKLKIDENYKEKRRLFY